jgi:hypothetical protein
MHNAKARSTRMVLSTRAEVRAAVVEVASLATRSMVIFTHDLEPDIYDHDDFLETLKRFILARSFARIRVLIVDPSRAMKHGNRFVTIGRRLNSYIEFRNVKEEYRDHPEAFCIADESALVYRVDANRWEGIADTCEPAVARGYLQTFDEIWNASEVSAELRQMHL